MTPSWSEIILAKIQRVVLEMHTAMPARVLSYNAGKQTAEVKPLIKWANFLPGQTAKKLFDLPTIPNVLVCHPRAGAYGMHYPIASGDVVLLIFCDRDLGPWRSASATQPYDPGTHDPQPLAGVLALPVLLHDSTAWSGPITAAGTVNIGKNGGQFDFVALDAKVQQAFSQLKQAIVGGTPAAGSMDGGTALQQSIVAALNAWPPATKNTDVKIS